MENHKTKIGLPTTLSIERDDGDIINHTHIAQCNENSDNGANASSSSSSSNKVTDCNKIINETIRVIMHAKSSMETIPSENRDEEYDMIVQQMHKYIEKKCVHQIVYDWIDISYDNSEMIKYCVHCYKTF